MKLTLSILILSFLNFALAEDKIKMNFNNEEVTKMIEVYAKATGQKFVVDSSVRGKATILLPESVSAEEAFNQLSSALAVNGFGMSKQGDTILVKSARNIQRDLIEVSTQKPSLKPERMYTWVYTVKNVQADNLNKELRILLSKDGELAVNSSANQLIFTDWTSNLNRVAELMKEIDKPVDPSVAKLVDQNKKEREQRRKEALLKAETEKH